VKKKLPCYHKCFACGNKNPYGLKMVFSSDDKGVYSDITLSENYIGYEGYIHGGIISTVVDEAMGWACISNKKKFYFTIELSLKFLKPVQPNIQVHVSARVVKEEGKILYTASEIVNNAGVVLVKSEAKFYPAKEGDNPKILKYLSFVDSDREVGIGDI